MSFQTAMLGTLVASLYGSAQLGTAAFTIWMYLIYATFPGIFTVLPARSAECFGVDLGGVVVGVIALSDILVSFVVQLASKAFLGGLQVHYFHLFIFAACTGPLVGFVITQFFPPTPEDGERMDKLVRARCCQNAA